MSPSPSLAGFGRFVLTVGCALLVLGLALGNFPYLVCAIFLLALAWTSRTRVAPAVSVERVALAQQWKADEPTRVTLVVRGAKRDGVERAACTLFDALPEPFALDAGSNFHALVAGPTAAEIEYTVKVGRRGPHALGPTMLAFPDPLFLGAPLVETVAPAGDIVVQATAREIPRLRMAAAWGITAFPGGDKGRRGTLTNDFRELRPYAPGDPLKHVNWKATARASIRDVSLIVNDYETESKKAVWIFLDASRDTLGGTTLARTFDEMVAAALSVAQHHLDRGHRVGLTLYGGDAPRLLYPDASETQTRRVANLLTFAEPAATEGVGLAAAVEATRGFLVREKPLVFVFAPLGRDPTLPPGLANVRALGAAGRRPAQVVVLSPRPSDAGMVEGAAKRIARAAAEAQRSALAQRGLVVIEWEPGNPVIERLLARGMLA
ncbi:MAG: DUF58 domain-containing protein [Thermoplasmatota archaeon]